MFTKKEFTSSKVHFPSALKISIFMFLLTVGFTSCQDEGITPNSKIKDNNIVNPTDNSTSSEKPPHEPDYGG